jgi:hypothetical protein
MAINDFDKFKKSLPSKGFSNHKNIADEDCDRPACDDTTTALTAALNQANKSSGEASSKTAKCPPKKGALGNSTWDLLHSMVRALFLGLLQSFFVYICLIFFLFNPYGVSRQAAWYPDNPSKEDQKSMKQFFSSFARFYPCTYCAEDFRKNLQEKPIK